MHLPRLKSESLSAIELATWGIFLALCIVSMNYSRIESLRSKQRRELSQLKVTSVAPNNLTGALWLFKERVRTEYQDIPIDALNKLPPWKELESTLAVYTERLKLLETHNEKVEDDLIRGSEWTSYAMLGSIAVAFTASLLKRWNAHKASHGLP